VPLRLCGKQFFSAAEKKDSLVISKELKFSFYECLNLTAFIRIDLMSN
jgi:hypothetical protein